MYIMGLKKGIRGKPTFLRKKPPEGVTKHIFAEERE
jgi:hypothetical protein